MLENLLKKFKKSEPRTWNLDRLNGQVNYNIMCYDYGSQLLLSHTKGSDTIEVIGYLCTGQKSDLRQKSLNICVVEDKERKKIGKDIREYYQTSALVVFLK